MDSGYTGSINYTCTSNGAVSATNGTCSPPLPAECTSATQRNFDDTYVGLGDGSAFHNALAGWYRLIGTYKKLQEQQDGSPVVVNIGNTDAPGFMQSPHPTTTGQRISVVVGFNWTSSKTYWTKTISVTNFGYTKAFYFEF